MKLKNIDISSELKKAEEHIESQKDLSPQTAILFRMLIMIIKLMMNYFGANSKNSGKPPSQDPFRKKSERVKTGKKTGGQQGHVGTTLLPVDEPDEIIHLKIDPDILPKDRNYRVAKSKKTRI